jgi:hypothetical protein
MHRVLRRVLEHRPVQFGELLGIRSPGWRDDRKFAHDLRIGARYGPLLSHLT